MDKASKTRRLLFRLGTVLILIGICVVMMIIGLWAFQKNKDKFILYI